MIRKIIPFEKFEQAVMHKIMEHDTSINNVLREQYKRVHIECRDFTGVGFFTDFIVPNNVLHIIEPVEYGYGDVDATINDVYGYGFVLFIKDGLMTCLEGYTWQDSWPDTIYSYNLFHTTH